MSLSFLWDYNLNDEEFYQILSGQKTLGKLDQDWAARRMIEYASYKEIIQNIGYARLVTNWPRWRKGIRSISRKRGLDFLVKWLPEKHPELCHE